MQHGWLILIRQINLGNLGQEVDGDSGETVIAGVPTNVHRNDQVPQNGVSLMPILIKKY